MGEEWIEWKGGKCPVDHDALVEFRCRDGYVWRHPASYLAGIAGPCPADWWSHTEDRNRGDDIIAYRVVDQSK